MKNSSSGSHFLSRFLRYLLEFFLLPLRPVALFWWVVVVVRRIFPKKPIFLISIDYSHLYISKQVVLISDVDSKIVEGFFNQKF